MENNKGIPVPLDEKQAKLMSALADELTKISVNITPGTIMYFANALVDRVVNEGWQWHPVATEWNLDHNKVALPTPPDVELYDVNSLYPTAYALRTPEQEVDILDRIVHGLPVEYLTPARPGSTAIYKKQEENIWVRIPDFENYQVNSEGIVRNRWTRRELEVAEDGGKKYVEMHDKDGFAHDVCIDFVMEKVYGK